MVPLPGALQYLFCCLLVFELYVLYLTSQFLIKVSLLCHYVQRGFIVT
jgi:hypothetical protein